MFQELRFADNQLLLELFDRLAYEIIKDYRENGTIRIENVMRGINIDGRVDWKKTIKLKTQMFSKDTNSILTD